MAFAAPSWSDASAASGSLSVVSCERLEGYAIRRTMSFLAASFEMMSELSRSPMTVLTFGYFLVTCLPLSSLLTSAVYSYSGCFSCKVANASPAIYPVTPVLCPSVSDAN